MKQELVFKTRTMNEPEQYVDVCLFSREEEEGLYKRVSKVRRGLYDIFHGLFSVFHLLSTSKQICLT